MLISGFMMTTAVVAPPVSACSLYGASSDSPTDDGDNLNTQQGGNNDKVCCPKGHNTDSTQCILWKYINPAIDMMGATAGAAVVIGAIVGGIQYSTSEGDPGKAAAAKKRIINSLVALAAFLLMYAFLQFILPGGLLNNAG